MKPGLVVKLHPSGPWRIGPDSGARNRVDTVYHSDSLYSAVTSAMGRLGLLEEWLQATVREAAPAVCFSSCFPFLNEIGLVVPPRTLWPPKATSLASARVRWKSARFVPLDVVRAILAGEPLNEDDWIVDGPSECLIPAGRPGPFRTGVRWNAAIDRMTGASERHATACIEFRPGAGLWTIAGFRDDEAHTRWLDPVKAAFRLLADTGFGGERSRGWGRSEQPEFVEGSLPDMILPETVASEEAGLPAPTEAPSDPAREPDPEPPPPDPEPVDPEPMPPVPVPDPEPNPDVLPSLPGEPLTAEAPVPAPEAEAPLPIAAEEATPAEVLTASILASDIQPLAADIQPPAPEEPAVEEPSVEEPPAAPQAPATEGALVTGHRHPASGIQFWLLSLFTPAAADAVDWRRGNYTLLARGGRVESPAGSGELKKQVQMVVEGSVLYADGDPSGAAPDVAPEGFAHPVFRAGFALAIPLPEVS